MKPAILICAAALSLLALASSPMGGDPAPEDVSMIRLIANPRDFDGKLVRVIGYARIEFEGTALYLHEADDKFAISRNAVWLDTSSGDDGSGDFQPLDRKYALIEGVFDADENGHMGAFSAAIGQITRHVVWSEMDGRRPTGK